MVKWLKKAIENFVHHNNRMENKGLFVGLSEM